MYFPEGLEDTPFSGLLRIINFKNAERHTTICSAPILWSRLEVFNILMK